MKRKLVPKWLRWLPKQLRRWMRLETNLERMLRLKQSPDVMIPEVFNPKEVIQKHLAGED